MQVGAVESLWRYPVKSMRGEELPEVFVGFAGVYGDRVYAFRSTANSKGFPYFTVRDQRQRGTDRGSALASCMSVTRISGRPIPRDANAEHDSFVVAAAWRCNEDPG